MRLDKLNQWMTLLANFCVIAGIAILVFELRQNNDLLESEARANIDANRVSQQRMIVENTGGIADLIFRARNGESLSDLEQLRLTAYGSMLVHSFESMYQEINDGPLLESDIPYTQWAGVFSVTPGLQDHFNDLRSTLDPSFVKFVDQRVFVLLSNFPDNRSPDKSEGQIE
jgi:hypothetical protein